MEHLGEAHVEYAHQFDHLAHQFEHVVNALKKLIHSAVRDHFRDVLKRFACPKSVAKNLKTLKSLFFHISAQNPGPW